MKKEKTSLSAGNEAFRNKNYSKAIYLYEKALIESPELSKSITDNIKLASTKRKENETGGKLPGLSKENKNLPHAVICHVYYHELIDELSFYLDKINDLTNIYFTVQEKSSKTIEKLKKIYPTAKIIIVENKGSDIYPFLFALRYALEENNELQYVCKIHTKSGTTNYPDVWREVLIESLLGTRELVEAILEEIRSNENVGMVGPALLFNSNKAMIYGNEKNIRKVIDELDWGDIAYDWPFFAGTMFWARVDIIKPLIGLIENKNLNWENHVTDGNIAHAVERIFGLAVKKSGKSFGLVQSDLNRPIDSILHITNDESLYLFTPPSANLSKVAGDYRNLIKLRKSGALDIGFYNSTHPEWKEHHFNPLMHFVREKKTKRIFANQFQKFVAEAKNEEHLIKESRLFDEKFYLSKYDDVRNSKGDAFNHFVRFGKKNRDPNPLFSSSWYASNHKLPDEINPITDYINSSLSESEKNPHPLFSLEWYRRKYITSVEWKSNPLAHYLCIGRINGASPHPFFEKPSNKKKFDNLFFPESSPVICRVPPVLYLSAYCNKAPKLSKDRFSTLEQYLSSASISPRLIKSPLCENDLRIIGVMDSLKRKLATEYRKNSQVELVTIIMPTKNRASQLPISVSSVLNQSYTNWELLLIDDGSNDNTGSIAKSFYDNRIKYIKIDNSIGNAGARNVGLNNANGSLITFLDDDDQWDPDFLLLSVNHLREKKALMLYSAQVVWDGYEPVKQLGKNFSYIRFSPFNRSLLENSNFISMITCIIDKKIFAENKIRFDETLNRLVDWDLFLRITEITPPVSLPCLLSHYFVGHTPESVTHTYNREECLNAVRDRLIKRCGGAENIKYSDSNQEVSAYPAFKSYSKSKENFGYTNIVIPNYECFEELSFALKSIYAHTDCPFRIVIVDNKSSYPARAKVFGLRKKYKDLVVITQDENSGFSFAVNSGIDYVFKHFDGDLLILNNDIYVTPGWLSQLQNVLDIHSCAGMAVPRQVLPAGHEISKYHSPESLVDFEVDVNISAHHKNIIDPYFDTYNSFYELNYAPMFCNLIRRSAAEKVGLLDAGNGPHFRSDWIYCDLLRTYAEAKIVYTPHSKVYHLQGISTKKKS